MDDIFEKTLLFDFYGELLTERQKNIYEQYHLEDLSLSEISEQMGISRQGVHDTIRKCEKQLHKYEEKLKLVRKFMSNQKKVELIYELALSIKENLHNNTLLEEKIEKIEQEAKAVLNDL